MWDKIKNLFSQNNLEKAKITESFYFLNIITKENALENLKDYLRNADPYCKTKIKFSIKEIEKTL